MKHDFLKTYKRKYMNPKYTVEKEVAFIDNTRIHALQCCQFHTREVDLVKIATSNMHFRM